MRGRDYPMPEERIHMPGDEEGCPVAAAETSPASNTITRLKVRTVLVPDIGVKRRNLPVLSNGAAVAALLQQEYGNSDREYFIVLLLDVRHHLIGVQESAIGSLTGVEVHPRETFKAAVEGSAAAIIVAHIHPSGDPTPSAQDIGLTQRLRDGGEILGIALLDHVILGEDGSYYSFRESGRL